MSDDKPKERSDADSELEREIRRERKFTLSEAIGRLAGPGCMKGASPVDRRKQAAAEIQDYLARHMPDAPGSMSGVLLRAVTESDLLLKDLDHPLAVLARCVDRILASDVRLRELVRQSDVEWGRTFDERPRFEREGQSPAPDDPYTLDSVRTALTHLASELPAANS